MVIRVPKLYYSVNNVNKNGVHRPRSMSTAGGGRRGMLRGPAGNQAGAWVRPGGGGGRVGGHR